MEGRTPTRNVRPKLQATDSTNISVSANSTDFPPGQNAENFIVKRNHAAFVFTAASGNTSTAKAKTRLNFEPSDLSASLPRESSESSNSNSSNSSFQDLLRPQSELLALNSRKRPKEALKPARTALAKEHGRDSFGSRRIPSSAREIFKCAVKNAHVAMEAKKNVGAEAQTSEYSNLHSRKLGDDTSFSIQEASGENVVATLRKGTNETVKPYRRPSRGPDFRNSFSFRESPLSASKNFKCTVKSEAGTSEMKQSLESEGEFSFAFPAQLVNDRLVQKSWSSCSSRPSLSGNKGITPSKLQRGRKLSMAGNRHRAEAASKLKAMENEKIQASRLAQARKDLWLDRQERAYTAWLNFVLKQPMKPNVSKPSENSTESIIPSTPNGNRGKRDSFFRTCGSDSESSWRTPRGQRVKSFRGMAFDGSKSAEKFRAEACLQNVCAVAELRQRLEIYLEPADVEDVVATMIKVAKYVEDGRLKMKEECPILTDVALKEKAVQVLTNYNPIWLRIGLYIVLGHNVLVTKERPSILLNEKFPAEGNAEADSEFLKLVIEKQFFAHAGLSKSYASNKSIDGLYRPGYYEDLGKVILKRFFLFVLALDKAKCQTTLPIRNGIDGLDGGSPLLFSQNTSVKSSRQALQNFLLDVMHGEGDLLGRLATIGYQVFHVQVPLADYDFHVVNLIENIRDGVRLCRLVQLLEGDACILTKIHVPSDHPKKNLHNCNVALQYLIGAGVPLRDEDGYDLTAEDLVMGDREMILSLIWNIFVHLQMPLLISKHKLCDEIIKIKGPEVSDLVMPLHDMPTTELMLKWIQAICATYGQRIDDFKLSFADGKSFLYLIDFYLPGYMTCSHLLKEPQVIDALDSLMKKLSDTKASTHKYSLVENFIKQLYDIPEVLQITDFLEGDPSCNERNVIILLTFLSAQLLEGKPMTCALKSRKYSGIFEKMLSDKHTEQMKCRVEERAVIQIQSWLRGLTQRRQFLRIKAAASLITHSVKPWLLAKQLERDVVPSSTWSAIQERTQDKAATRIQSQYRALMEKRQFLKLKTSISTIQRAIRSWLHAKQEKAAITIQSHYRGFSQRRQFWKMKSSVLHLQYVIRASLVARCMVRQERASIIIQSHYKGLTERRRFLKSKAAVLQLQRAVRGWIATAQQKKHEQKVETAATIIQSHIRGWLQKSSYILLVTKIRKIQHTYRDYRHKKNKIKSAIKIQSSWQGWLARKNYKEQKSAAIVIQRCFRGYICRKQYKLSMEALIKIQSVIRGRIMVRTYLNYKTSACKLQHAFRDWFIRNKARKLCEVHSCSTVSSSKIQTVGEKCKLSGFAIVIQAAFRGCRERQRYRMKLRMARRIQAIFRGGEVRQKLSEYMSNKRLKYGEMDCTPEEFQVLTKTSEAARTIQRFYRGHAARLLCSSKKKENMTKSQDVIAPKDLASAENVTHDLSHDVCISNSHKTVLEEILNKYIRLTKQRRQFLKVRNSAIVIQSHFRGWLSRRIFSMSKSRVILIQAFWRSYLVRKNQVDLRQQFSDLRFRMKNTAANVDDSLRLENRLTKALDALLNYKTVSGILHTCATLDMATQHSKRCCERLVAAGAIEKLLHLINSTNRSAPHEEVLKHALSVLCNIAHYPELARLFVDTAGSINTIAEQLTRNKEEGFCKAAELLKRLCAIKSGPDAVQKVAPIIRRLQYLAQNLEKKVGMERRSLARLPPKGPDATRKTGERRLREADSQYKSIIDLLECVTGESSRRRSGVHESRPQSDHGLKRVSSGPLDLSRHNNKERNPFQDCSNH